MKTFVQFGAGNIGRSFIGRLFAEAGYKVIFVDVDRELICLAERDDARIEAVHHCSEGEQIDGSLLRDFEAKIHDGNPPKISVPMLRAT